MYTFTDHETALYANIEACPEGWYVIVCRMCGHEGKITQKHGPFDNFYLALGVALKETDINPSTEAR